MATENSLNNSNTSSSPRRLLDEFAGYTSLHGFHFVIERNAVIRRIIWTILLFIGFLSFGLTLKESITKLTVHKTTISREIDYSSELKFPAVTLCNVNMMKKSKILGTDSQYFLDQLDYLLTGNKLENANRKINASFDIETAVRENGHTARDMVKLCSWMNGAACNYHNFTTFVEHKNGLCHTFNSGEDGNPIVWAKVASKDHGLLLVIDIEPMEYYGPYSYLSTGIQVTIHEQHIQPKLIRDYGVEVMPGVTTYFQIKKQKIVSLPLPYKSACGARKLETTKNYSKETCLYECFTRTAIRKCGCRLAGMPVLAESKKTNYCSPKQIKECSKVEDFHMGSSICDCPIPCERFEYKIQQNTAYFPSPSFWPLLLANLNMSVSSVSSAADQLLYKNYLRQRMMIIQVHFKDLNTEVVSEIPAYEFHDLISDVGGILGLFLGCSFLTVFEFVDFIIILLTATRKPIPNLTVKAEKGETRENYREESRHEGHWNNTVDEKPV